MNPENLPAATWTILFTIAALWAIYEQEVGAFFYFLFCILVGVFFWVVEAPQGCVFLYKEPEQIMGRAYSPERNVYNCNGTIVRKTGNRNVHPSR